MLAIICTSIGMQAQVVLQNHSKTPSLVNINTTDFPSIQTFALISSWDTLTLTPTYRFAGSADGAGIVKNHDGTFTFLVNQEDNFSVSRIILDNTFKPIKADYILNSDAGMWRLCSGTMATPEEHGFGPVYLTCGESSAESMTHMINPSGKPITDANTSSLTTLTGFGRWNAENAVPLPKNTFSGKTVVIIGDDDSGPNGGQLAMYVSTTGDLVNGKLYVMRRTDLNQIERQVPVGSTVDVEFVLVPDHSTLTGAQINTWSDVTGKSLKFGRVEDIDYRKGNADAGREIYFNATGTNYVGQDSIDKTIWGRVYRLVLDKNDPLKGKLECILDGDDKSSGNLGAPLYQPDNICVTEDYVYVQEDPNGYTMNWALPYVHDARIYQYDIEDKTFKIVFEFNHHRSAPDSLTYNRNSAGLTYARSGIGSWEYGAMIDVSKETGIDNAFVIALQPHSFRWPFFAGVDGGVLRASENQGSMLITATGIPRIKAKAPTANAVTICAGNTARITATGGSTFAADNGTTYRWYADANTNTVLFTGNEFTTPVLTGNATYYVSSFVSGSESSTRTAVNVTVNPAVTVDLGTDKTGCESVVLDAGNAGAGFNWSNGKNTQTITVTENGKYKVTVTNNNCSATDSVNVTINAKPATPVISVLFNLTLKSNYTTGNKWFKDGNQVATTQEYTVTEKGIYTLTHTDANNCTSDEASVSFASLGIEDAFEANGFRLFPNPNNGTFTLKHTAGDATSMTIQVVNMAGQLVYLEEVKNFSGNYEKLIDLSKEADGNYIVNIITDKTVVQKKIIKQ